MQQQQPSPATPAARPTVTLSADDDELMRKLQQMAAAIVAQDNPVRLR